MQREVVFYRQVMAHRAGVELRNLGEMVRAALYVNKACDLAGSLQINGFNVDRITADYRNLTLETIMPSLYALEIFMSGLHAKHLFEIEGLNRDYVLLNDDWRAKAHAYISHVRD